MTRLTDSRTVGDAVVTLVPNASWIPSRSPLGFAPVEELRASIKNMLPGDRVPMASVAAHVQIGVLSIVIDSCQWTKADLDLPRFREVVVPPGGELAGFAEAGIDPARVTHVIITHGHRDHYTGCRDEESARLTYPNAKHFLCRSDWEQTDYADSDSERLHHVLWPVHENGQLELYSPSPALDLAPGVTLVHTPGHTPGHHSVRVESKNDVFFYVGDLLHIPAQVANPHWVKRGNDASVTRASRERVFSEAADRRATVVFTHNLMPSWGRIVRAGAGYQWLAL